MKKGEAFGAALVVLAVAFGIKYFVKADIPIVSAIADLVVMITMMVFGILSRIVGEVLMFGNAIPGVGPLIANVGTALKSLADWLIQQGSVMG